MRQPKTARALGAALTALGAFAALPALAQDTTATPPVASPPAPATPPAPANGPGPATQPPPPPGTALPAPTQPAPETPAAPAATPPPNYGIQTTGLIDGYYLYQFNNPKFSGATNNLGAPRVYDIRHNSPTLALAELNVFMNPRPNSFGFKATLQTGDTADINTFGQTGGPGAPIYNGGQGENRYKSIAQLYGTYAFGGDGSGVDFGKFYTPFGYEVTEANADYNYSRSLAYNLVPFYHFGARIYAANALKVTGLTATFYLVNALYNTAEAGVQDDNKQPAYIGQLNYAAPSGKFSLVSELGMGKDKLGGTPNGYPTNGTAGVTGTNTRSTLSDTNFTYNLSSTVLAGLDYVYLYQKPDGGGNKLTANGYAVYFRQQFTPKQAYALRVSGYDVHVDNAGAPDARPYEFTATYEYKVTPAFTTRLEYRHDQQNGSGGPAFASSSGAATKSSQDTLTVAGMFTF